MSRSGATILGGELLGVDRKAATLFTFYLAVPTMMGATLLELHQRRGALSHGQSLNIAIGFVVSFIVAFFVIREFLHIVTRYGLKPFGWYRIAAGLALIGSDLMRLHVTRRWCLRAAPRSAYSPLAR